MKKLHRVVAAVDYSAPARAAFDRALAVSRQHGAELTVVHAVPAKWPFNWYARERRDLIAELRDLADAAGVRFNFSVQAGDPAGVITLHANARRADLVVLGTSERSRLDRLRFGSVAENVVLDAAQPVLVVPPAAAKRTAGTPLESIVVAVDLNEGSSRAIARALSLAGEQTRITVVHAVPSTPLAGVQRYMYRTLRSETQTERVRSAWRKIAALVPAVITSSKIHARVVAGQPAAEITRVAAEVGADVILVGVTPRGVVGRLFAGSTAARVIRNSSVPVLAIPLELQRIAVAAPDEDVFAVAA